MPGFRNDETGAAAYPPAMLLKVILYRETDQKPVEADLRQKEAQRITRLQRDAAQLRQWPTAHPEDRTGSKGTIRKSNRLTLRGQQKVDAQWQLYCLVHNIEKLAHLGYAQ